MSGDPSKYADGRNTEWSLVGYSKQTGQVDSVLQITREQLETIRPLFDVGDDLWFSSEYPVGLNLWPIIEPVLHCGPPDPAQEYMVGGFARYQVR